MHINPLTQTMSLSLSVKLCVSEWQDKKCGRLVVISYVCFSISVDTTSITIPYRKDNMKKFNACAPTRKVCRCVTFWKKILRCFSHSTSNFWIPNKNSVAWFRGLILAICSVEKPIGYFVITSLSKIATFSMYIPSN
jgi:hypothetical protein